MEKYNLEWLVLEHEILNLKIDNLSEAFLPSRILLFICEIVVSLNHVELIFWSSLQALFEI
jgi:hypothetical protein